jgi:hypothetical protein
VDICQDLQRRGCLRRRRRSGGSVCNFLLEEVSSANLALLKVDNQFVVLLAELIESRGEMLRYARLGRLELVPWWW